MGGKKAALASDGEADVDSHPEITVAEPQGHHSQPGELLPSVDLLRESGETSNPEDHEQREEATTSGTAAESDPTATPKSGASGSAASKSAFSCNICFDVAADPVLTRCGHLFCWACLHEWLSRGGVSCPVCKAGVKEDTVIPIYSQGSDQPHAKDLPKRPRAERQKPAPATGTQSGSFAPFFRNWPNSGGSSISVGFAPFLGFTWSTSWGSGPQRSADAAGGAVDTEEQSRRLIFQALFFLALAVTFVTIFH